MTERVSLAGRTIALAEHRELDRLAEMIEQLGGTAYRCPFISIVDAEDPAPILRWLERLLAGDLDDVVFLTGEGVTRLVHVAKGAGLEEAAVRAFGAARTVCRGPKPVRALRAIGVRASLVSEAPTTDGVIATLAQENLAGRRVGVQLYGEEPNDKLVGFLAHAGAEVHAVSPYTYEKGPEAPVLDLIAAMAEGRISVMAFTSSPQVHRLVEVAEAHQRQAELRRGLERTRIAAVGPIVAGTLAEHEIRADIVPERSFFLRPMVNDIAAFFAARSGKGAAA
jgi:uroporphyrinogen-III synthase